MLLPLLGACVSVQEDEAATDVAARQCEEAELHLEACTGEPIELPHCDPEDAERVLSLSCEALTDPGKADWLGDWLCGLGWLRHCAAPDCAPQPAIQAEIDDASSCADYIGLDGCGACDYYLCREAERAQPCGADGYYVGFGHNYCDRFSELTAPRLSPAGQQWIADVRACLQLALEDVPHDLECDALRDHAYATHPACYVETGFCQLPITDLWTVLNTVELQDLGFRQPLMTGVSCLGELFDPQTLELTDEGRSRWLAEAP